MAACKDPEKEVERRRKLSEAKRGKPLSSETRKHISDSNKGKKKSMETIQKMVSASLKRYENPEYRSKIHTILIERNKSEKMRNIIIARNKSEEMKNKVSIANTGRKHSEEIKQNMRGRKRTPEGCKNISRAKQGRWSGSENPKWAGGVSFEPYCPKFNKEFKERVRAFFSYNCVECGTPQNGTKLHIHHVNFDKKTCCNTNIPLFVALCHNCHAKTNGKEQHRLIWQTHFTDMINNYYLGKCYFTQEEMKAYVILP